MLVATNVGSIEFNFSQAVHFFRSRFKQRQYEVSLFPERLEFQTFFAE